MDCNVIEVGFKWSGEGFDGSFERRKGKVAKGKICI